MIYRKTLLASGIATAIFAVSSAGAATLQSSHAAAVVQPTFNVPSGSTILYDQTGDASGNGAPAQNFSAASDAYDSEAADDFVVPAGGWTISTVNMVTSTTGPFTGTAPAAVNIYPDAAGMPGASAACSFSATATVAAATTTIPLAGGCSLAAGTYWVAVSVQLDFTPNGQIFWSNRNTQTNSLSVWRNPGDGFATGCTNWGTVPACNVGGAFPDFQFQILGAIGGGGVPYAPAAALPTMSQWSALLAAGGLALLGLFAVRRRARR